MDIIGMYPTFYVPYIGTAWIMGIIGVIHVLASHTSVGASFLFAILETKAYRDQQPQLMDFIKRYGLFLLVFSYIIGSITGPGIWYAITVTSPRGVSGLIHNFVWVWAAEWVFFTVEVIGVYALVYLIGKIDAKSHLKLTWSFALASWSTMLLIVGILSFMMWPGHESWYQTGSTNAAFYNLNFFAHLGVRTGSMFVMAAVVGLIVAAGIKDLRLKREVIRLITPVGLLGGILRHNDVHLLSANGPRKRAHHAEVPPAAAVRDGHDRRCRRHDGVSGAGVAETAICENLDRGSGFSLHCDRRGLAGGADARKHAQALCCRTIYLRQSGDRA